MFGLIEQLSSQTNDQNTNNVITILNTMKSINNLGIITVEDEQSSSEENLQSEGNPRKRKSEPLISPNIDKCSKNI
jgi:hypothetical protein